MARTDDSSGRQPSVSDIAGLCRSVVAMARVDGAAIAIVGGTSRELVYATDAVAQYLDELQFTMGQGPCVDAVRSGSELLIPDLANAEESRRWPGFTADATTGGAAAVFAFPLKGGSTVFGVLELYRGSVGVLSDEGVAMTRLTVAAVARALLDDVDDDDYDARPELVTQRREASTRPYVNIAVGMITVQLQVTADEAFDRLRAAAYSQSRPVDDLARDVVERRVRFSGDQLSTDSTTKGQQS